jgi:mRNA-degrading endonuclease RelE of RelBE toxin-antitoxin system
LPELRLSKRAREQLNDLPRDLQIAVVNAMDRLALDPRENGKPLRGRMRGTWVAKVGSYRILYTIEGGESSPTVVVRAVLHRAAAYRRP